MKFPFGKYKGESLYDIPEDYLEWVLENVEMRPMLKTAVKAELNRRNSYTSSANQSSGTGLNSDLLTTTYRTLCKKWHPDAGGNTQAMQALNEFYQLLKS